MKTILERIRENRKVLIPAVAVLVLLIATTVSLSALDGRNKQVISINEVTISLNASNGVATNTDLENSNMLPSSGFVSDISDIDSEEAISVNTVTQSDDLDAYTDDYSKLAIAKVTNYVNVRAFPDETSDIVGYIYNGAVANIEEVAGENDDWFKINSGNVTGYIKAEFFISGEEANEVADQYITRYATVICDRLNVRQEASAESSRMGYIENGEKVKINEDEGDWLVVEYTEGKTGYISADFVTKTEEFTYARTLEEDRAIKEAEAALLAREVEANSNNGKKENLTKYVDTSITPADSFGSNAELRKAIVDYACGYVGLPYVWGGRSLATGTDCSGFTMLIYQHFGYGLSPIPQGQLDGPGRRVSYSEIQPGDIVLYSSKGVKATHAALYIGNGQVVHETNHRYGVLITSIDWIGPVWAIKNVID